MNEEPISQHENWAPELNRAHAESVLQGGCQLDKVPVGGVVIVTTRDSRYVVEKLGTEIATIVMIAGHPKYCPNMIRGKIIGSVYHREGSMLRLRFIGRGMFMEFGTEEWPRLITSEVLDVVEI